jgi:hypothetical protein
VSDEASLPPLPSDSATIDELRAALRQMILWANAREPAADGSALDKFLTARAAVNAGQLTFVPGGGFVGGGGGFVPGPGTSNPADATPPTPISGLIVTSGPTFFFVEFDAPSYAQGGGNGRTIIYQANYSGTGPLPTFSDAVEAATVPGRSTIVVISAEPGVQAHFWAKAETRHPTLQASPTGGINGVSATAGKIDGAEHIAALSIGTAQIANLAVTDAKVASLSVSKLIAGSIAVGEFIQSTGYTGSGVNEWRIDGNGVARFTGVIVSGEVNATSGSFGGITVNGSVTLNTTGHIKGGQTDFNTGTGFFIGYSGAAYKFSIGNATLGMTWDGAALTINGGGIFSGNVTGSVGGVGVAAVLADIASRLRRDANEILGAVMTVDTVASPAGFRAGTLTWDASGAYVSGSGVAMTPLGLVGYSGSTPTFTINASTGAATFAGALSAATGTFAGALSAASGSFVGTVTVGSSPAVSGTTMTGAGAVFNSGGTFAAGSATRNISFNGTTLTINGDVVATGNIAANATTVKATQTLGAQSLTVTGGIVTPQNLELTTAAITKITGSSIRMTVSGYITVTFKGSGFSSGLKKLLSQVVVICSDASNALAFTPQSALWFREEPIHVELSSVYSIPFEKTVEYDSVAASGAFHITLQNVYFAVSDQLGVFSAIDAVSSATLTCSATIEEVKR